MFTKILIANRGEIACRVIKTANRMGIKTVAVFSDADRNALHVKLADEAIYIGPSPASESYLVMEKILAAAKHTGAQAIHPGYGFLSENADFAQACADSHIVFIGPPAAAIAAMGSKSAAKQIMEKAGVPLVPGYHGDDQDAALLKSAATSMGFPVLLKAVAGGGGKGMRPVFAESEFDNALAAARREAKAAFGDDAMLVEKYLQQPRHIEIQVFCDTHGNAVYLGERDCSIQRRHQKIIEEAPAPGMTPTLREKMGEAAVRAAQAINYVGAGTVEFLLDKNGAFYFMEMNTRLQVEHPVTEMITGQDLVEWQLRVADGQSLPLQQEQIALSGHAMEARVYAEDTDNNFMPAAGYLAFLQPPHELRSTERSVRVDTGVMQGDDVSIFYDPMIAKLIVWARDRDAAAQAIANALQDYRVAGLTTNIRFLHALVTHEAFLEADLDTHFIEKYAGDLFRPATEPEAGEWAMAAACLHKLDIQKQTAMTRQHTSRDTTSPWQAGAWRMNHVQKQTVTLQYNGLRKDVVLSQHGSHLLAEVDGHAVRVRLAMDNDTLLAELDAHQLTAYYVQLGTTLTLFAENGARRFERILPELGDEETGAGDASTAAPMTGRIVSLLVEAGHMVKKGEPLLVMEAMKMEHTIKAPANGSVSLFYYEPGAQVEGGAQLLAFEAETES